MRNFVVLLLFSTSAALAGFERADGGARARGLGGSSTALGGEAWCAFANPAGLAALAGPSAGFFIAPRPFGFGELSYGAAVAALPIPGGACAIAATRSGYSLYREETYGFSLALRVPGADLGAGATLCSAAIERYGSASAVALHAGCLVELLQGVRIGLRFRNINAPSIGESGERIRPSASFGALLHPHAILSLAADVEKDESRELSLRAGAECAIAPVLVARIGLSDNPSQLHAGAGVRSGIVQFDYAFILHGELGASHEWSLSLSWGGARP